MSNKVIIWIIILILVLGGGYFLAKNVKRSMMVPSATTPTTSTMQQNTNPTSPQSTSQPSPSQAMMQQTQNTVTLTSNGFSPATLTVPVGTTVTWINKSGQDATVNSNPHPIHTDYPPLNLGSFADGASLSLTFSKAGTYGYHNHFSPSETGTIIVK